MISTDSVVVYLPPSGSQQWEVRIAEHPVSQTVVFEATTDWKNWQPVTGERVYGPGPVLGKIYTNAVAGGPALFRGWLSPLGVAFRVRCTVYSNVPINMTVVTGNQALPVVLVGTSTCTFIIEEEKTIEELLTE